MNFTKQANGQPYYRPSASDKDEQVRKTGKIPRTGHDPDSYDLPYGFGEAPFKCPPPNSPISDLSRNERDSIVGKTVVRENDYAPKRPTSEAEILAHNERVKAMRRTREDVLLETFLASLEKPNCSQARRNYD